MTSVAGYTATVPARTLSALLDESGMGAPDLIVLDLEGHELEALTGLDLERHTPRLLMVESLDGDAARPRFEALLGRHMQFEQMLSQHDLLFRARP